MANLSKYSIRTFLCAVIFSGLGAQSIQAADAAKPAINPNFNYMSEGNAVSGWGIQLGDPENWSTSVEASRKSKSATGKLSIEPIDFQATGDALKLSWSPRKAVKGVFSIYGTAIDLSKFENEGAIVFDMKMDMKPDKDVTFGMDCSYPCRSEIHVSRMLKDLKKDEWTTFPIPLNCFTKEGLDIKKVNGPVVISTEGRLGLTITNIRLQKLPEGEKGCAK
ncbi:MAG TPA: putative glycoside hydrolase [Cellvibrio sp.]|nr:putative glycoside hydrolase [Cellvibrio sp.]